MRLLLQYMLLTVIVVCACAGLDYITEYQKQDRTEEPRFVCDLCASKMDPRQVVLHATGIRHRMKYFVSPFCRNYQYLDLISTCVFFFNS